MPKVCKNYDGLKTWKRKIHRERKVYGLDQQTDYTTVRKEEYSETLVTATENPPKAAYGAGFFLLALLLGRTGVRPVILAVIGRNMGLCRSTLRS